MTIRTVGRFFSIAAAIAFLWVAALLLCSSRPFSLGDYVEWTYHGMLFRDVLQGHPDPAYILKHYPVPNSMTTVGLGLLMLVFTWKTSAALWLVMQSGFGFFAAQRLSRAAGCDQGWQKVFFVGAVIFGAVFWYGFTNFLLGVFVAMLICSILVRDRPSTWTLGFLFTWLFFCHMIPFAFCLLALTLYAWDRRSARCLLAVAPGVLLTVWYIAGRYAHGDADGHAGMESHIAYMSPAFAAFKLNTFLKCFGFINPAAGPADSVLLWKVGPVIFVILFGLNILMALAVLVVAIRSVRKDATARFVWAACIVFFAASLFLPGEAAGVSDPGGRMMEIAVWFGVALAASRTPKGAAGLGLVSSILLIANLFLLTTVASRGPGPSATESPFPLRVREFGRVLYLGRWNTYDAILEHRMDLPIYPTALFLEAKPVARTPVATEP